jgi:hypothetical protein
MPHLGFLLLMLTSPTGQGGAAPASSATINRGPAAEHAWPDSNRSERLIFTMIPNH